MSVPPGANGVVGLFSNVMNAKRWVQTAPGFLGFDIGDPSGSGKKECIRAIQEAAAYAAFGHYEIVGELTGSPLSEAVFTGGAANGRLWPQIVADVLGVPVHVPRARESTALGAAMYAAVGAGLAASVAELGAATRIRAHVRARRGGARDLRRAVRALARRLRAHARDGGRRRDPAALEAGRRMTAGDLHAMGRRALEEIGAVIDRIPAARRRAPLRRDPRRGPHRLLRRRPRGADDQGALHAAHAPRPRRARRRRHDDAAGRARRPAARERRAGLVLDGRRARGRRRGGRRAHGRLHRPARGPRARAGRPGRAPAGADDGRRPGAAARACCRWAACTRPCNS